VTRQETARDRLIVRVERAGAVLGVTAVLLMVAGALVMRRRGAETDAIPRSPAEQRAMLASGECAVRPNGAVVGKRVARTDAASDGPRVELEAIDHRRVIQVDANEVEIVPCITLQR
jgi:hypothetical protein